MKLPCVYIVASGRNGTLYTGVTSDLLRRVSEHRDGIIPGFTRTYRCKHLVWYEQHDRTETAILREKQLKGGNRKAKLALIESANPDWTDLYSSIVG
jgi:predicted GIY-YIG superfamily endonuclease